jgi:hypothetical protein
MTEFRGVLAIPSVHLDGFFKYLFIFIVQTALRGVLGITKVDPTLISIEKLADHDKREEKTRIL